MLKTHTFTLPTSHLNKVEGKLVELGKKAEKIGVAKPTHKVIKEYVKDVSETDAPQYVSFSEVEITYEIIVILGGWHFIALLETVDYVNDEPRNRVSGPNLSKEDSDNYITAHQNCEHCNYNRNRKQTFIIKNSEGTTKQVGSTCLEQFLGINPINVILSFELVSIIEEFSDESFGGGDNSPQLFKLDEVAGIAVSLLAKNGFVSAQTARDSIGRSSTADDMMMYLMPTKSEQVIEWKKTVKPSQENIDAAKDIVNRLNERILPSYIDNPKYLDTFSFKIGLILNRKYADSKDFSILAAAINREGEFIVKQKLNIKVNEFYPTIEESKIEFNGIVQSTREISTAYGLTILVNFVSNSGHILKTFYSGSKMEFNVGAAVKVKGTVKKLEDHEKYGKTVLLTRVKIVP